VVLVVVRETSNEYRKRVYDKIVDANPRAAYAL